MESIMAEPITLTIDLDLDQHLVRHIGYDEDGEERTAPQTLEDVVIGQVVEELVNRAVRDQQSGYSGLRKRVEDITREEISAAVRPLVAKALEGPIRRTNSYGEVLDRNPTTLRDMIFEQVTKALTKGSQQDRYGQRSTSVLSDLVKEHVDRILAKELKGEIDKAKAEVVGAVRAKGAEVLAETIKRAGATL
jgi:hypothetical protein